MVPTLTNGYYLKLLTSCFLQPSSTPANPGDKIGNKSSVAFSQILNVKQLHCDHDDAAAHYCVSLLCHLCKECF